MNFPNKIMEITSAWKGHENFAFKIVDLLKPKTIVDLGVDNGFSTFVFSYSMHVCNVDGCVYGIDTFNPYGRSKRVTYKKVLNFVKNMKIDYGIDNIKIIKGTTSEVAENWDKEKEVDILHIDADHGYESVKNDFEKWSKFLSKKGLVLFHDVNSFHKGPKKFFSELDLPKFKFLNSAGLGVASWENDILKKIRI